MLALFQGTKRKKDRTKAGSFRFYKSDVGGCVFTESLNVSKMSMLYYNGLCGSVLTVDTTIANVQVVSHLKDCSSLIMTAVVLL